MNWIEHLNSLKNDDRFIICDSLKVSQKVLNSGLYRPVRLIFEESFSPPIEFVSGFKEVSILSRDEFKEIKGKNFHKGVITVFENPGLNEIHNFNDIETPFVILNGVTSPENVGAIIRTISGLGFKSLIIDSKSLSPLNRRVLRVSMGNFVFLKFALVKNLKEAIINSDKTIYATANDSDATSIKDWLPKRDSGVLIGSEGHGIDEEIKKEADLIVKIPIDERVQHLNAGHACAIICSKFI